MMKQNIPLFIYPKKLEQLLTRITLTIYLNRSLLNFTGLLWIINSVVDRHLSKYKFLNARIYITLPKKLYYSKKVSLTFKIIIVMNILNHVSSNTFNLQIFIQQRLKKLGKLLQKTGF